MNADDKLVQKLNTFRKQFKYKYVGGGYFRDNSVPKGINAEMQHGDEIINKFCDDFEIYLLAAPANEEKAP
jgi:2-C-methyl-D-erythritol 4-phosphate cytidylyltransferase